MNVHLLYFEGCPNWKLAPERLAVIAGERPEVTVSLQLVETETEAERLGFSGSPSIQLSGVDLFAEPGPAGLWCRRYSTPSGYEGAPTLEQPRAALADA